MLGLKELYLSGQAYLLEKETMLLQSAPFTAAAEQSSTLSTGLGSIAAPLVLLVMGVAILSAVINRQLGRAGIMAGVALVTSAFLYNVNAVFSFINSFFANMARALGADIPAEEVKAKAPEAPKEPNVTTVDVPWEILGFVAVAALLLGVIVFAVFVGLKKARVAGYERKTNTAGWEKLMSRHNAVRKAWASYETDMVKIIDFPLMNDMKEPVVAQLHGALRKAQQLEPSSIKVVAHVPYATSPFAAAVQELEIAFESSEREAKKIAWSKFTHEERKNLAKAKDLLSLAMDTGASASERQIAYKRVIKELEGLVSIPSQAMLAIEASTKLELTAA